MTTLAHYRQNSSQSALSFMSCRVQSYSFRSGDNRPEVWKRWLSGSLAGLLVLLGAFVVSPEAHGELHDDAHDTTHACAITLAAHGFCDTAPPALQISPTDRAVGSLGARPSAFQWETPQFWHAQALAPPARGR